MPSPIKVAGTGAYESGGNLETIASAASKQTFFAPGYLRVAMEPSQLFLEGFDTATLDITNKWKVPTAAGGGVAASNALTFTQLGTGTTANGYSYLESQPAFPPVNPGWLYVYAGINIPFPYVANTYFFWGLGTSPTTPTAAAPLTNAAGFEVAVGGKMYAVTYQSGTRQQVADLSSTGNNTQPLDSNVHKYFLYYKGDTIFWCIDNQDTIVAQTTTGQLGPDVNALPLKFSAIAGSVAPASSGVLTVDVASVGDTSKNIIQVADATYPWRQVTVDTSGSLQSVISGPAATSPFQATVTPYGDLRVQEQPTQQFFTAFDAGLDTTNIWKTPTAAGGGVAATSTVASTTLETGTTGNGYSYLESQVVFPPESPGWLLAQSEIGIEFPVSINAYRFWGLGTSPATPTAAAPLTNAVGFEVATSGKMYAVVYASGTRFVVQDLSVATGNGKQPQDGAVYSYNTYYRDDKIIFSIGSLDNIVAQTFGFSSPDVNALPVKLTAIAGSTPPGSSVQLICDAFTVSATSRNNFQISDGVYQWRKATVDTLGNLRTSDFIRSSIATGNGFRATTTLLTTSGTNTFAGFLARVNNLSVNVCIYNIVVSASVNCPDGRIYYNSTGANTDAGLTTNLLTANATNQVVGGAAPALSVLSGSPTPVVETTGMGGTGGVQSGSFSVASSSPLIVFLNSSQIILPKNTTRNASVYVKLPTTAQSVSFLIEWIEF